MHQLSSCRYENAILQEDYNNLNNFGPYEAVKT